MVNVSFLVAINKEIKGLLRFYRGNLKRQVRLMDFRVKMPHTGRKNIFTDKQTMQGTAVFTC